jgi:hypothetical protein
VSRIWVTDPDFRTPQNLGVGSTAREVKRALPTIVCDFKSDCTLGNECYERTTKFIFSRGTVTAIVHSLSEPCE